ncbi:DMT family transporter [Desulfovibrio sp.]
MRDRFLLPVLALLTTVVLWGLSYPAMKTAVTALDPQAVMWARMVVALLTLLPVATRVWPRMRRADLPALAAMCLLMPCAYFFFESNALRYTTSMQAGIVSATVPLLVAVGAWMFLKEPLTARALAGLLLALAGVSLMSLQGRATETASDPLLGNALEVCAMICAAGSMLVLKRLSTRYGSWALTMLQTVAGVLFFLPGAPVLFDRWEPLVQGGQVWILLFLGAGASLGAFGLYNWGMSRMEAGRASAYINLVPVMAVVFGWLFLGESLSQGQVWAALLVLAGVGLSQMRSRPRRGRSALGAEAAGR